MVPSASDILAGRDDLSFSDRVLKSAKSAREWFQRVASRGVDYVREVLQKLSSDRYKGLMATMSEIDTRDERQSQAWLMALEAKLSNPKPPLSSFDKGLLDGLVTSLAYKHSFLSLLLPNLYEVFSWGESNNGNQEVKLAPQQAVRRNVVQFVVVFFCFVFRLSV